MGQEYLIDTNTVIDYLGRKLPLAGEAFVDNLFPEVSIVTRMEVLGWYSVTAQQLLSLLPFFQYATVYLIDENIVLKTIEIRQQHRIKLPDAIIAATAIENNKTLITRNISDFKNIRGLSILNVWDL